MVTNNNFSATQVREVIKIVKYITSSFSTKSRFEIDSHLIEEGYNPKYIDQSWLFLKSPLSIKNFSSFLLEIRIKLWLSWLAVRWEKVKKFGLIVLAILILTSPVTVPKIQQSFALQVPITGYLPDELHIGNPSRYYAKCLDKKHCSAEHHCLTEENLKQTGFWPIQKYHDSTFVHYYEDTRNLEDNIVFLKYGECYFLYGSPWQG